MTDFNDILRKSLSVVNEGYRQALDDLNQVVGSIRDSIKQNAGQQFAFELREISSDLNGTVFQIYLDTDINDNQATIAKILELKMLASGYPINLGSFHKANQFFIGDDRWWNDKEGMETFFAEQLASPDSALIQAIGYALRQRVNK